MEKQVTKKNLLILNRKLADEIDTQKHELKTKEKFIEKMHEDIKKLGSEKAELADRKMKLW